jgi:hypothetical protein
MARIAKSAADLPRNSQISLVEAISMASSRATVEQFTELTYATGARVVEDHRRRRPRGCRHDGRHRRAQAPRAPPLRLRRVASTAARAVGRSLQQRAQLARTSPRFTRFSGSSARMTERVAAISAAALARSPLAGPLLGAPAPRVLGPTTLPSFLIDPASPKPSVGWGWGAGGRVLEACCCGVLGRIARWGLAAWVRVWGEAVLGYVSAACLSVSSATLAAI